MLKCTWKVIIKRSIRCLFVCLWYSWFVLNLFHAEHDDFPLTSKLSIWDNNFEIIEADSLSPLFQSLIENERGKPKDPSLSFLVEAIVPGYLAETDVKAVRDLHVNELGFIELGVVPNPDIPGNETHILYIPRERFVQNVLRPIRNISQQNNFQAKLIYTTPGVKYPAGILYDRKMLHLERMIQDMKLTLAKIRSTPVNCQSLFSH